MSYIISFVWLWRSFVDVGRPRWTPVTLAIISLQMYNMSLLESSQVFYRTCVRATIFSAIDRSSTCACIIAPWDLQIRDFFYYCYLYLQVNVSYMHDTVFCVYLWLWTSSFFWFIWYVDWYFLFLFYRIQFGVRYRRPDSLLAYIVSHLKRCNLCLFIMYRLFVISHCSFLCMLHNVYIVLVSLE